MLKFLENNFGLIANVGLFLGLFLGDYIYLMPNVLTALLFVTLFLSAMKVDLLSIADSFKKPLEIINLSILKLLVLPFLVFLISFLFAEQYRLGLILLAAAPAAVAAPAVIAMLGGNVKLSLLVSVITNLLAPLSIPLVLALTVGTEVELDLIGMFIFLLWVVCLPFLFAFLIQKYNRKMTKSIKHYSGATISVVFFIFGLMSIAPYANFIFENFDNSIVAFGVVFLIAAVFHLFSYLFYLKKDRDSFTTALVTLAYFNDGLVILIAAKYFDETTLLITVFYEFPWLLGLPLLQRFLQKKV